MKLLLPNGRGGRFHQVLRWIDAHGLMIWASFLLAFIPLWPKIPLWSPIEQYIVRVRLEDFFILFGVALYGFLLWRRRVSLQTPLTKLVIGYAVVSFLSVASAIFVTHTIPLQPLHVAKSMLHFVRYLQYFSLFFLTFAAIRSLKDVKVMVWVGMATVAAVSIYGFGQKYYFWPVYSTMNREFSKGVRLYLTPHARVQSTFAGHYDMAAYLVIVLPIVYALADTFTKRWQRVAAKSSFWLGTWLMIVSASRASFFAFIVMIVVVAVAKGLLGKQRRWRTAASGVVRFLLVLTILVFLFGEDLTERVVQVIDQIDVVHDTYHRINGYRRKAIEIAKDSLFHVAKEPPKDAISSDEVAVLVPSDQRPEPVRPGQPADVYVDVPDIVEVATVSATGETQIIKVDKGPRVWSEAAKTFGLSLAIRLDTLWPRAIEGFLTNPFLGKGYATLNKDSNEQFTEAESTDNNFLRTLGETGLFGFAMFYGAVVVIIGLSWRTMHASDVFVSHFAVGMLAGTIGLLINAMLIDVFAASKVAQSYWAWAGVFLAAIVVMQRSTSREHVGVSSVNATVSKKKRASRVALRA